MPKLKTHSGAKKRFKVTGTGKVKARKPNRSHNFSTKNAKRERRLRKGLVLESRAAAPLKQVLQGR
ncbi:MAG: 50S ribosomal protein L35 [Candidatus Hydrogenedentota bacterium]|nr:MAG: 50S ribosomal protein L35 [Candidatus Hydrogenedentota bacterium]